jgi:hypothetical protein
MIRYKSIREDFRSNFLDQAEQHLKDGNFHSAVRSVGRALGMRDVPSRYDKQISTQEKNYMQRDNNINNFVVLQNIKKILLGKGSEVIPMKRIAPVYSQKTVDKKIQRALDDYDVRKQSEINSEPEEDMEDTDIDEIEDMDDEEFEYEEEDIEDD